LENGAISFGHGKVLVGLAGFPQQLGKAASEVISNSSPCGRPRKLSPASSIRKEAAQKDPETGFEPQTLMCVKRKAAWSARWA